MTTEGKLPAWDDFINSKSRFEFVFYFEVNSNLLREEDPKNTISVCGGNQ
jgi:hypothetical protein